MSKDQKDAVIIGYVIGIVIGIVLGGSLVIFQICDSDLILILVLMSIALSLTSFLFALPNMGGSYE